MNYKYKLVQELLLLAKSYGANYIGNQYAHPNEPQNSSLIFNALDYNFQTDSWNSIQSNTSYLARTKKVHSKAQTKHPPVFEMQSSNSSDALAMNIFCYPDFIKWNGVKQLFQINYFRSVDFGFKAKVLKTIGSTQVNDETEIDISINDSIFVECKLTEGDFTSKEKSEVEHYSTFRNVFHTNKLLQNSNHYHNYQLIRNILAAHQHNKRFMLICDMRRPDLVKSFYQTVGCIKDNYIDLRCNCEIIYWQDIAQVSGSKLQEFLKIKYGIF